MASLYLLIPVAILFVIVAVGLFLWAVKNKQFDDLDNEGQRILFDQHPASSTPSQSAQAPGEKTILEKPGNSEPTSTGNPDL